MTRLALKRLARINARTLPEETDPERTFRYVDIESVAQGRLAAEPELTTFAEAPSRARRLVALGDTIVSTVRTYLRAVWTVDRVANDLVVSTGFAVVTPGPGIYPRFLGWALQSKKFIDEVVARSEGVSYPAIRPSVLGQICLPIPDLAVQKRIAEYLDRETARVDALIAKKERLLGLSEERKWNRLISLIHETDTRSLPIRRVLLFITDGPFGSAFSSSDYSEYGAAVVRLGNIGFGEYRSADQARIPMSLYRQFPRCHVSPGDVLIAGLGDANNHAGRACVAPDFGPAMVKGKCFCARVDRSWITPDYLAWLLASPLGAELVGALGQGSTRTMINLELIKSLAIPVPNVAEQEAVIRDFARERERIAAMSLRLHRQVALLRQKRQALITASVTGRIHVPGAA